MKTFVIVCFILACCCEVESFANFDIKDYEKIYKEISSVDKFTNLRELIAVNITTKEPGSCQSHGECLPGGLCTGKGENGNVCRCFRGVNGDYCKTIEECVQNPLKCGDGNDVECSYDPNNKIPYCECKGVGKRFDVKLKKCVDQKSCKDYKECKNAGQCEGETNKYCMCKPGTYGDYCENIEECENNPNMCGSGDDVKCKYNYFLKRAFCHCLNGTHRYDVKQKKCVERKPCSSQEECGNWGVCTEKCQTFEPCKYDEYFGEFRSCHCVEGTSGEKCETVNDCYNKVVDCGTGDNVECKYSYVSGIAGSAYCKCTKKNQTFDRSSKLCKDCDCGPMAISCSFNKGQKSCSCNSQSYNTGDKCEDCDCGPMAIKCSFNKGQKVCSCNSQSYNSDGKCEDCECGEEANGCKFKDGKKECICKPGFQVNNGVCEMCNCGDNSTDCKFENGLKICSCESGFTMGNSGVCIPICNHTRPCENGGLCLKDTCMCPIGTAGPYCERIYECEDKLCGEKDDVLCKYNALKEKAYCQCRNTDAVYDPFDESCKVCRCDTFDRVRYKISWESCEFARGKKICHCKKGYALEPKLGICYRCNCGGNLTCEFDVNAKKVCGCDAGFQEWEGNCIKCDCGPHGKCVFNSRGETIHCDCDYGFVENDKKCKVCYCGPDSKCSYINEKKVCECPEGYRDNKGSCEMEEDCYCGPNSKCYYVSKMKICVCPEWYEEYDGYCERKGECSCRPDGRCVRNLKGETIHCDCDTGYAEYSKTCKRCYCGPVSKCTYKDEKKVCKCSKGYKNNGSYCKDIDECLKAESCSKPGQFCINTPGSFRCECKQGYIYMNPDKGSKTPWCRKPEKRNPTFYPSVIIYGISIVGGFLIISIGLTVVYFKICRKSALAVKQPEVPLGSLQNPH